MPMKNMSMNMAVPWIDLKSERYDFKTELNDPFAGFQKLRAQASYNRLSA